MNNGKIKIIILGTGGRGRAWVDAIKVSQALYEPVALVNIHEESLYKAAEIYGLSKTLCFKSLSEAAKNVDADAVMISTPSEYHVEACMEALGLGFNIIIEKPFTLDLEEAEKIVAKSEKEGLKIAVVQNYRYKAVEMKVQQLLREKTYGEPCYINYVQHRYRPDIGKLTMDQPVPYEMCIHHFDSLLAMLEGRRPVSISAMSCNPPWSKYLGPAAVMALLEFQGPVQVSYVGTFGSMSNYQYYRIECSEGTIVWRDTNLDAKIEVISPGSDDIITIESPVMDAPEKQILQEFYRYVTEDIEPKISGRNNLTTLGLVTACIKSTTENKVIKL